jgi:hypothetical protein
MRETYTRKLAERILVAVPLETGLRSPPLQVATHPESFFSSQAAILGFLDDPVEAARRFWIL